MRFFSSGSEKIQENVSQNSQFWGPDLKPRTFEYKAVFFNETANVFQCILVRLSTDWRLDGYKTALCNIARLHAVLRLNFVLRFTFLFPLCEKFASFFSLSGTGTEREKYTR